MNRCRSIVHGSIASCVLGVALMVSLPAVAGDSPSKSQAGKISRASRTVQSGQHPGAVILITVSDDSPGSSWARLRQTIGNGAAQTNLLVTQTMLAESIETGPVLPPALARPVMDLQPVGRRVSLQFEQDLSNLLASR
jgi:hypothetical protein